MRNAVTKPGAVPFRVYQRATCLGTLLLPRSQIVLAESRR